MKAVQVIVAWLSVVALCAALTLPTVSFFHDADGPWRVFIVALWLFALLIIGEATYWLGHRLFYGRNPGPQPDQEGTP